MSASATPRRALVTGGDGFVGRHLVAHLLAQGWQIDVLTLPAAVDDCRQRWGDRVGVHAYDGDSQALRALLATRQPDTVFHLASLFLAQHRPQDIAPLLRSNVLFGTELLDAMSAAGVRDLVNAGTSWQHFDGQAYSPVNLYAASKQAFEAMLRYYVEAQGLRALTLKLFDTYGPDDPRPKLIHLLRATQQAATPLAMSPGEQMLDLLHVDDVVAAFAHGADWLRTQRGGEHSFGLPSGERLSLRALVALIDEITGTPCRVAFGARPYRPREVMQPWDGQPILPGWAPRITLRDGLRHTFLSEPPAR